MRPAELIDGGRTMALIRRENGNERSLARSQSWDPFQLIQQMMNWDPLAEVTRPLGGSGGTFTPRFEVKETKDSFVFRGDLPGLQEKDLEVSLTGNRLTISGKREEEHR